MTTKTVRPKFLNLFRIHLPITGVVSFAHRVTGALLVICLPFVVFLFSRSLQSEQGFQYVSDLLQTWWIHLLGILVVWSLAFHLLSGVRFLLLDLDIGMSLSSARASAWLVGGVAILVLLLIIAGWCL